MSLGFKNDGMQVHEYVYDFAVDGGAASAIDLSAKSGALPIPAGAVLKHVTAKVLTSVLSLGSATVEWGNGNDADGYSGTAIAKATLVAGFVSDEGMGAGALLWDNTNDSNISLHIPDATAGKFLMTINVAALTAGKVVFMCEYLYPKAAA